MARGVEGNEVSSKQTKSSKPAQPLPAMQQKTLFGFFQKTESSSPAGPPPSSPSLPTRAKTSGKPAIDFTPAPSSDPVTSPSLSKSVIKSEDTGDQKHGLPSPISPGEMADADVSMKDAARGDASSSPSRKAKKQVNYHESDGEGTDNEEEVFKTLSSNSAGARSTKRRRVIADASDEEYGLDVEGGDAFSDDDMDDFIVADDSEEDKPRSKKRKHVSQEKSRQPSKPRSPPVLERIPTEDMEIPTESTARQWTYDPENLAPIGTSATRTNSSPKKDRKKQKEKAHKSEPEKRYTWLADLRDADRHSPEDPEYDPRTVYIPPMAWKEFSPFEKQYWEIKQHFFNTIVFFKKGKFYELYEHDATIGHQLFDLKLTDRVNMRMVGVPESSLDHWARQFVSHGYKIAKVDQMENALAKEMRERDEKPGMKKVQSGKEDKVIRRELTSVLTNGTLVDGGMLEGDMATFCAAIKEDDYEGLPAFGIAFVDTATAQFHIVEFVDDADWTKFETFVAQIRPAELLLEKSCLSARTLRILKNNTSPTTIWNFLKPTKEFWPADITTREIDACGYFGDQTNNEAWPEALRKARDKDLIMSAFGALVQYLRTLKIDRELVSLGNFEWYDPIRKATSLVLDGQSLINLEIFANSFDGGTDGTLFSMLNRCVTPFGKRMLRQWVCHPLADSAKINARLDAVEALIADIKTQDTFSSSLSKLPDLERLISRVHAGRCKAQDFLKILEGFEQIEYTMSILGEFGSGEGVLGQLLTAMPDLSGSLKQWQNAFNKSLVKEKGVLVPELGVEEDFDASIEAVEQCERDLAELLRRARKDLSCSTIQFKDIGKEIYQLEVPAKVKNVPKNWDQMSATAQVKRYYSPELRKLVRDLQEARETNAQVAKEVAGRFYARFDTDYNVWLTAVKVIANLDCLISLAKAASSLGTPSCRPTFVDSERSVLSFTELRHPTMLTTVNDFIPNSITLGGDAARINLLTGANAAGKSTVLRMSCIAVILAQLGCYVPCYEAVLTPCDRIMSRLGANDNIMQQQSTFFVELAETKKMLSEATPRSLVILDELGRGTSSVDGLAVAEAVLHHIAGTVGCVGFFATHYHSLAHEFSSHPEVRAARMAIEVDNEARRVTFLYKLEEGIAEGSFGMHCASMCGIPKAVVDRAAEAAGMWEHSGRVQEVIERRRGAGAIGLGWLSDLAWMLHKSEDGGINQRAMDALAMAVDAM